jgi:anti-sigma B factor antagonist
VACDSYGWETPALAAHPAGPGGHGAGGPGGPGLDITIEHHSDRIVLRLHGELDVGTRESLCRAIRGLPGPPPQTLVLDISALGFMDCGGLSVLVWAHRRLAGQGHQLIVTPGPPIVNRLLRLTGLDTYLDVGAHCPGSTG